MWMLRIFSFQKINILLVDEHTHCVFSSPPLVVLGETKDILVCTKLHNILSNLAPGHASDITIRPANTCLLQSPCPPLVLKWPWRCPMIYIGNTGRTLKTWIIGIQEQLRDIQNLATKPVFVHFNSTQHSGTIYLVICSLKINLFTC